MNERIKELADEAAKYSATMFLPTGENGDALFIEKFADLVAAAEREACAKICDAHVGIWIIEAGPASCATAIRARGNDE